MFFSSQVEQTRYRRCILDVSQISEINFDIFFFRFLICGDDDKIFTLEDKVMAEGQMLGTAVPFSLLEKKVEETGGFLHVKIFIEKINRTF